MLGTTSASMKRRMASRTISCSSDHSNTVNLLKSPRRRVCAVGSRLVDLGLQSGRAIHARAGADRIRAVGRTALLHRPGGPVLRCLLYTSDAADEEDSVDLGGRRIIKKKKKKQKKTEN